MQKYRLYFIVLALGFTVASLAQNPENDKQQLPREATLSLSRYTTTEKAARTKLVTELKQVLDRVTKAGHLDEAIKLKATIEGLQQNGGDPSTAGAMLSRGLVGTKWQLDDHNAWTFTLHPDFSVTSTHHAVAGTWAAVSDDTIRVSISMENCNARVLTLSPDLGHLIQAGVPTFHRVK